MAAAGAKGAAGALGVRKPSATQALLPSPSSPAGLASTSGGGGGASQGSIPQGDDRLWANAKVKTALAFNNIFKLVREKRSGGVDAAAAARAGQMSLRARMAKKRSAMDMLGPAAPKRSTDETLIRRVVNELPFVPPTFDEDTQGLPSPATPDVLAASQGSAPMTYLPLPTTFEFDSATGFAAPKEGAVQILAPPQAAPPRPRLTQTVQMLSVPQPLGRNRSGSGSTVGSDASGISELSRRPSWEQEETTIALSAPEPDADEAEPRRKSIKERLLGRS